MSKKIKNIDSVDHTWGGQGILAGATYTCLDQVEANKFAIDDQFLIDLSSGKIEVYNDVVLVSGVSSSITFLKTQIQDVDVKTSPPFAQPDYRTKRDANAAWVTCPSNSSTNIDFILAEERYVTGGEIIYKNIKEGDYITAEVNDINSVIPSPYRSALCENWPTIAKYIVKKFLFPTEPDKYGSFEINTYPLNAKISAGLCLRITLHTTAEAGDRKAVINYSLTKKL
jgi:hypothetical protein